MPTPEADKRSAYRRARDEALATETPLAPLDFPAEATFAPVETHRGQHRRRPVAAAGIVENGVVRPLDPTVKLAEHMRVIIVASEQI